MDRLPSFFAMLALAAGLLLLAGLALHAPPALAHAIVMASQPLAGATVEPGSRRCELRFNNRIDRKRSRLVLAGPLGAPASAVPEQALVLRDDSANDVLVADLRLEAPGRYRLRWQVLALDGHVTRGEVPFTVAAPSPR